MKIEDFNIEELCDKAMSMCKQMANIDVHYNIDSLESIDAIAVQVSQLKDKGLVNTDVALNIALPLGTFAGEIMLKDKLTELGYKWQINEAGLPIISDRTHLNAFSPVSMLLAKITGEDTEDRSLKAFYDVLLIMNGKIS